VFVKLIIQEISCNNLHKFCESKVPHLIAQNQRLRFKLEFNAEGVYLKMLQRAIAMNQFKAAYLIQFNAMVQLTRDHLKVTRIRNLHDNAHDCPEVVRVLLRTQLV